MHHSLFPAVAALALVLPGAVSAQEGPLAMQQITHVDPSIEQEIVAIRDTAWRAYFANDQATMARLFPANFDSLHGLRTLGSVACWEPYTPTNSSH